MSSGATKTANNVLVSDFFGDEYRQYAIYDSYRSIASFVDGMKPTARKIVHTLYTNNIKIPMRVSQFGAQVSKETNYLHGEASMFVVIANMGKSYVGSNNYPLIKDKGNFGSRHSNHASAPRYIYTCKSDIFDKVFDKNDGSLLPEQMFEGDKIEPRHYMPTVPVIILNGSEGIGSGFSQKILPRKLEDIKAYLTAHINGKPPTPLPPFYKGFNGTIKADAVLTNKFYITGCVKILNTSTVEITEIPTTYELTDYLSVLDTLVDDKIIKSYSDKSVNDKFHFTIKMAREDLEKHTEETLIKLLKLSVAYTENYTSMDENNCIREFNSIEELVNAYMEIRLVFYAKRKQQMIVDMHRKYNILANRGKFIKHIIDGTIVINKKTKVEIEEQIVSHNLAKVDDSFNYLLNMPIYALTKEKITDIVTEINNIRSQIGVLNSTAETDMWLADINQL